MVATRPVDFRKRTDGLAETCKLCAVEPFAYLSDVLGRISNDHPNSQIDELLPWAYITALQIRTVA